MIQFFSSAARRPRCAALWLAVLAVVAAPCSDAAAAQSSIGARPNILLILADDLGFSDLGCYGSEIPTPNLDRLARQGVRFSQFYNTARCCPSRASLLTGLYPHQAGIGDMVDEYAKPVREKLNSPAYSDRLRVDCPTIGEALKAAGYRTGMAGKWHVGYDRPNWPVDRGFDRSLAVLEGAMNYWGHGIQHIGVVADPPMALDGTRFSPPREGFFATDAWADFAIRFLTEHRSRSEPFFFYLPFNAPHWPLHARPETIARFRGKYDVGYDAIRTARCKRLKDSGLLSADFTPAPRPAQLKPWQELPREQQDNWSARMSVFAAQVAELDTAVGRVLDCLRDNDLERNTVVLFLSDNGGAAEVPRRSLPGAELGQRESYTAYGLGGAYVSSAPFRLHKVYVHEGGIASPLLVRWPAHPEWAGRTVSDPAHLIDLMPTCLDLAGADPTSVGPARRLEGRSLLPLLEGKSLPERLLFWEHEGNRAVRAGDWKLVGLHGGPWELYNFGSDRTELVDLASKHADRVEELSAAYHAWAKRCGVLPWPVPAPTAKPSRP